MTARIPDVLRPEHPEPRPLAQLAEVPGVRAIDEVGDLAVTGATVRTNEVAPGDLFVALRGANAHGAQYAAEAAAAGAIAVLTDPEGAGLAAGSGLVRFVADDPRAVLGAVSVWLYGTDAPGRPRLYGITGTNGKTSTAYLLEAVLKQLGEVTGLSSTAERHIGDLSVVSRLTTPEASELHALLARMREAGVQSVAVEVSAQALTSRRVDGLLFDVVGFTTLSHDHLDDYGDMDTYLASKLELFTPERGRRGVVSLDTPWGGRVAAEARIPVVTVASAAAPEAAQADWVVEITAERRDGSDFTVRSRDGVELSSATPVIGRHMVSNAALALVMAIEGGWTADAVQEAVRDGIHAYLPGRTELVSGPSGPAVYVDFGHSSEAFANTLEAVRRFTPGKVLMLFGSDGDRDPSKRPEMARTAAAGSDILMITDHHPRFEDPDSIRATLLAAAREAYPGREIHEVSPPEAAIRAAIALVGEGDSILWAGPGHQDYRDIRGVRTPYSAREEARRALAEAGWPPA